MGQKRHSLGKATAVVLHHEVEHVTAQPAHVAEPNLLLDIEAKRGMFIRLMKETTSPPFDPLAPHRLAGQRRYHLRKGTGVPNAVAVEPMHPRSS